MIYPCLVIISGSFVLFSVILTFIIIEPIITLFSFSIFTFIYTFIFYISKNRLNRNGERISINQVKVVRAIHEGLKGIRDIIIEATQKKFIEIFSSAEIPLRKSIASMNIISGLPRIGIETLGLIFIIIISYGFVISSGGLLQAVPILGAFALGAQKLLPVMQQIYQSFANIKGTQRPLNDVLNLLEQPLKSISQVKLQSLNLVKK